jgi:hypothetical protein
MQIEIQENLKKKIKEELKSINGSSPSIVNDEILDTFFNALLFPLNNTSYKLDGLQTRVPYSMWKILLNDLKKEEILSYFPDLAKIEPYLKKILLLQNPTLYQTLVNQNKGLAVFIDALGLNPNNLRLSNETLESARSKSDYAIHLLRVYNLRNIESHNCEFWTLKEIYENIESILIIYLYATYKHLSFLKVLVNQEPDLNSYLDNVVFSFERWQERFVHMKGKEKFEEIDLYAVESDEWSDSNNILLREGKIDELRNSIDENTMVLLGEPGMGKSTTMQYLAYKDAQNLLNYPDGDTKIPIYLELKLLSKNETILEYAKKKTGLSLEKIHEYSLKGKITLYLDGLNELLNDLRKSARVDIQNLIVNYPDLSVMITSRPLAYSNEFKESPVFILQKLENIQIEEFLEKNCPHKQTKSIILSEVNNNLRLTKIVRIPLLLLMLINVVYSNKGIIPANKVQIIKKFIQNLFQREKQKMTTDIDLRIIHRLLCFLGYKTRELKGSNVGCQIEEIEAIIEKRIEESRFKLSVFDFLDNAIDLNILVKDGDKYSFVHELYQEYFASEEFYKINVKQR